MSINNPSPLIIEQRFRYLIIEYVRMVTEYEAGKMPGLPEIICMWQDIVSRPVQEYIQQFQEPVYTSTEKALLHEVDEAWGNFSSAATDEMIYNDEAAALATPEWRTFANTCSNTLAVLSKRGKLPED